MKRHELDRLIKLKEAELEDLRDEHEQVVALEAVLASKPLTNKEEVDQRIRAKVIDLLLENFRFTPLRVRDEEPISEDIVVLDDEEPAMVKQGVTPEQLEVSKAEAQLRAEAKAEVEAEEQSLTVLEDGQSLDDLIVEDDDEDDSEIESGTVTRSLKAASRKRSKVPQAQGNQTPQQPQLPSASFYKQAQSGAFDADSIPPEYLDRVKAKRTDDGETGGTIRRKS